MTNQNPDILSALWEILESRGVVCTLSDVYETIDNIAGQSAYRQIQKAPRLQGPTGMMGAQGEPGVPGKDDWDKFAWDRQEETLVNLRWKGVDFLFPVADDFLEGFPEGEITYGDVQYIRTVYGNPVVERMSSFWRREYEKMTDMKLFLTEEDVCNLKDISKFNSSPDLSKVS